VARIHETTPDDTITRDVVVNAFNSYRDIVRAAAITALGEITPDDAETRDAVVNALVARLSDSNHDVRAAAVMALGEITPDNPRTREAVANAIVVTCLGDSNLRAAALAVLSRIGPIAAPMVLTTLRMKASSAVSDAAAWIAIAIALSGAPGKPSDTWAYLTFL